MFSDPLNTFKDLSDIFIDYQDACFTFTDFLGAFADLLECLISEPLCTFADSVKDEFLGQLPSITDLLPGSCGGWFLYWSCPWPVVLFPDQAHLFCYLSDYFLYLHHDGPLFYH